MLGIPSNVEPIAFMSLGFPADVLEEKERKPLVDLVTYETW
jgi:hypothetical protein